MLQNYLNICCIFFEDMEPHKTDLSVVTFLQNIKFVILILTIVQKLGSFCGKLNENQSTNTEVTRRTDTRALCSKTNASYKERKFG